jgi:hypothetical protein
VKKKKMRKNVDMSIPFTENSHPKKNVILKLIFLTAE